MMQPNSLKEILRPYRMRTWIRRHSPWFMIERGWMQHTGGCEQKGGEHEFYNVDGKMSAWYHCGIELEGQLWVIR